MPTMEEKKIPAQTNIMLDLDCTSIKHTNPAIMQIAAVHFDIDTGEEFDTIEMFVNLGSCRRFGLKIEPIHT